MSDAVATRLRAAGMVGRTVQLKVRFGDFRTITRSATVPSPVDGGVVLSRVACSLLSSVDVGAGVRLLGVSVSGLTRADVRQLSLDDAEAGWGEATRAVDEVRERFGSGAIVPASVAVRGAKRRGEQQWGPS
jgi:DNA polymerase-4